MPSPEMLGFAALGALALWFRLKFGHDFRVGAEEIVRTFASESRISTLAQIVIFTAMGALLSVVLVEPSTIKQALAAGMAWTSLLGDAATVRTKRG